MISNRLALATLVLSTLIGGIAHATDASRTAQPMSGSLSRAEVRSEINPRLAMPGELYDGTQAVLQAATMSHARADVRKQAMKTAHAPVAGDQVGGM